jgi:transcription antitermination factor NusG
MPILAREIDCFPPDLFESLEIIRRNDESQWWVAYTRSRREKDLMRRLVAAETSFYCPIIAKRTRAPSGRVRESYVALFPGYVFVHGDLEERRTALATNCVSWINSVADQPKLTRELAQIRRLIASNVPITAEERLESGFPVRVMSGPLKGHEGTIIERRGKRRLLVSVDLLQQGASVDLDQCDVQPL